jgi:DNA-binding transcriptional LysR family regulator
MARMEPEARLLRYFLAVATELNFTRAAETLSIAQPALSAQIRQLEAQLGVQLLERTTRSVRLTDAGRIVQERGPGALAALADVWEAARRAGRGEAGRLRLAYSPSSGYETVPRLVAAVRDRLPGIEIAAEVLPSSRVVQTVIEGGADVGIARTPVAAAGIRLRTIRNEAQGLLVPTGHPLAARAEVELAEVAAYPLLMHEREVNPAHYDFVIGLFRRAGLTPRLVSRPMEFDPTLSAVRDGTGVTILGASVLHGLAPGLQWVPLAGAPAALPFQLVLREGEPAPVADRFERIAVATAAVEGWLDADASTAEQ